MRTIATQSTTGWHCQICGEPIASSATGQVLFSDHPQSPGDFLVFHQNVCDPHNDGPDDLMCTDTLAIVVSRARTGEFGWAGLEFATSGDPQTVIASAPGA